MNKHIQHFSGFRNIFHERMINSDRREEYLKFLVYAILALFMFVIHLRMTYISDDAVIYATIKDQTLLENFIHRWTYNGRIFTDVLANLFYRIPMIFWKVFNVGIYVLLAVIIVKTFTNNTLTDVITVCVLIVMFPIRYLSSAGWVATATNYLYTVLGLLVIVYHIKQISDGKKPSILMYIAVICSVLYTTNHDQTAMVLIGGLLLFVVYLFIGKENKKLLVHVSILFLFSVVSYVFMFCLPGHIYRMTDTTEMQYWFPQYSEWSFIKKVYEGYSTTVANLFFGDVKLFSVFCLLLSLLALSNKHFINKLIGIIPCCVIFLGNIIGHHKFIVYESYSGSMPDLINPATNCVPLLLTFVSLFSIFWTVFSCVTEKKNKYLLLMLLLLAAGSREMMGFSATIFASSFRTFTVFLYAMIICILVLLRELKEKKDVQWYTFVAYGMIATELIT